MSSEMYPKRLPIMTCVRNSPALPLAAEKLSKLLARQSLCSFGNVGRNRNSGSRDLSLKPIVPAVFEDPAYLNRKVVTSFPDLKILKGSHGSLPASTSTFPFIYLFPLQLQLSSSTFLVIPSPALTRPSKVRILSPKAVPNGFCHARCPSVARNRRARRPSSGLISQDGSAARLPSLCDRPQ